MQASAHFSSLYLTVDKSPSRLEPPEDATLPAFLRSHGHGHRHRHKAQAQAHRPFSDRQPPEPWPQRPRQQLAARRRLLRVQTQVRSVTPVQSSPVPSQRTTQSLTPTFPHLQSALHAHPTQPASRVGGTGTSPAQCSAVQCGALSLVHCPSMCGPLANAAVAPRPQALQAHLQQALQALRAPGRAPWRWAQRQLRRAL